jgi:hypothetical protein
MSYQTPPSSPLNIPDSRNYNIVGFKCRQVDKYDGQFIYSGNKAVYGILTKSSLRYLCDFNF